MASRGRRSKAAKSTNLQKVNQRRSESKKRKTREKELTRKFQRDQAIHAEKFEEWFQTLKAQVAGKGNHLRSHAKEIILLLLLSSFRKLAKDEKYTKQARSDVFQEVHEATGASMYGAFVVRPSCVPDKM